jgi:stress-induced-phosphoprotein 1
MNPTWPRGYQRKGTALFYLDQIDEAIDAYKEGLVHDPNNAELQKNIREAEAQQ